MKKILTSLVCLIVLTCSLCACDFSFDFFGAEDADYRIKKETNPYEPSSEKTSSDKIEEDDEFGDDGEGSEKEEDDKQEEDGVDDKDRGEKQEEKKYE